MASKTVFLVLCLVYFNFNQVESASLIERSYEYVMNLGKNLVPSVMSILDCMAEEDVWGCAKSKAAGLLDGWNQDLNQQRLMWQEAADAEIKQSGRSIEEMPSKIGRDVENSLTSIAELMQHGLARAFARKHGDSGGGVDTITISTSGGDKKKKEKKKKQKPAKIQLVQVPMMMEKQPEKGRGVQSWVIGHDVETELRNVDPKVEETTETEDATSAVVSSRGFLDDAWSLGEKALDSIAEHAVESENAENGIESDKSSLDVTLDVLNAFPAKSSRHATDKQRGKKKKKKKAILKLLLLGAVLKAKIGTLLQILSFKLQVKFFIIALLGLAINLARFWIDLKKTHHQQPQKVIYYEHAQHQHHYDEHEEPSGGGWGPWSRSMEPNEETDVEIDLDVQNSPYRAQERHVQIGRPVSTPYTFQRA